MRENSNKAQEISTYKTRKCKQTLEKKKYEENKIKNKLTMTQEQKQVIAVDLRVYKNKRSALSNQLSVASYCEVLVKLSSYTAPHTSRQ